MSINGKKNREIYLNELLSIDIFADLFLNSLQEIRPYLIKVKRKIPDLLLTFKNKLCVNNIHCHVLLFISDLLIYKLDGILETMDNFSYITNNMKNKIKKERINCIKFNELSHEINEKYEKLLKTKEEFYCIAEKTEKETFDSIKLALMSDWEQNDNWKKLLNETKEKYNEYKNELKDINQKILNVNESKNILINSYDEINKEYNDLFINYLNIIVEKQKNKNKINEMITNLINNSKNIKYEYYNKNLYEKSFEIIPFEQYHTKLNFDECGDDLTYRVYATTIGTLEKYIDEYVSKEEKKNEKYKIDLKINLKKILLIKNDLFNKENQEQILNYINNPNTHQIFLSMLTKTRVNGFEKSELFIRTMGECFDKILDEASKKNDLSSADDCIILSQTYYYRDKNSDNKVYIIEFLKKNKWITSSQYWLNRIDSYYKKNIEKIKKNNIRKWEALDDNKKNNKMGEILLSQIIPSIYNMFELINDKTFILKVIDNILQKYNYLDEEQKNTVYKMIGVDESDNDETKNGINNNLNNITLKDSCLKEGEKKEIDNNNIINENININNNIEINNNKEKTDNNITDENREINNNDCVNKNINCYNNNDISGKNEINKNNEIKKN